MFVIVSLSILALCTVQSIRLATNLGVRFAEFVFFSTFGLIFGLAPVLQSKDCYASEFGLAARNQSAWFALFGFVMLACGFALARKSDRRMAHNKQRLLEHIQKPQTQRFLCCFFWASVLITIFSQFLMMHSRGITISDLLNSGRFAHRFNNQGLTTVLSTHLTSFAYVPAFVGVFLNRKHQYILLAYLPLASLLFFYVFAKGTRSIPLAMLMTTLVAGSIRYRFSPQKLMLTVGAGSVGLLLAIGLYELREQQDSLSFAQSAKLLLSPKTYETMWDRDPLGYGANLVGAVATFPDAHPYLDAATYRRMLVFYLQESRFPHLKPPDSNILFGLVVHQRDEALQVTSPPSILGDVWINFWGWWGLPALFLHGWLYCWLLQRMQTSLTAFLWVGPLIGRFLVLVHRGEPYEMFVLFFMFFFAVTGVAAVCRLAVTKPTSRRHHRSVRVGPRAPRRLTRVPISSVAFPQRQRRDLNTR